MSVGTRAHKRGMEQRRLKEAKSMFNKALEVGHKAEADIKLCISRAPFLRRFAIAVRIIFGVWK